MCIRICALPVMLFLPLIVGVYYYNFLHPSALKRHSCYHLNREKEEIALQVMHKCVCTFLVRAMPITVFVSHGVTTLLLSLPLWMSG